MHRAAANISLASLATASLMSVLDPHFIDDLCAGVLDVEKWARTSIAMGDWAGATGAHVVACDPWINAHTGDQAGGIDPALTSAYRESCFAPIFRASHARDQVGWSTRWRASECATNWRSAVAQLKSTFFSTVIGSPRELVRRITAGSSFRGQGLRGLVLADGGGRLPRT